MEYRLYSFVNYYLSSIQQGIQTGHAAIELVRKYTTNNHENQDARIVSEWADKHKTFVVLNGGNCERLLEIIKLVDDSNLQWAYFREDEVSLGGLITAVAVIVPENIFNVKSGIDLFGQPYYKSQDVDGRDFDPIRVGDPRYDFVNVLKTARLAQ